MKTIGIIGSRSRDSDCDLFALTTAFNKIYEDGDEIVSGGCPRGGDRFAEKIAKDKQIPIKIYYAQWDKHGKAAGFIRNSDIAKDANILIALVSGNRKGGTEDTIKKVEKMGKEIIIISAEEEISQNTLSMMDKSVANLNKGIVSDPINLPEDDDFDPMTLP